MVMRLLTIVLVLVVAGCGATGKTFHETPALEKNGKAEIVVFRPKRFGDSGECSIVKINDKEAGILANGGFLRILVVPGKTSVSVPVSTGRIIKLEVDSKADASTFVEYRLSTRLSSAPVGAIAYTTTHTIAEVAAQRASSELQNLRESSDSRWCSTTATGVPTPSWPQ
jgi:hypothetical protein